MGQTCAKESFWAIFQCKQSENRPLFGGSWVVLQVAVAFVRFGYSASFVWSGVLRLQSFLHVLLPKFSTWIALGEGEGYELAPPASQLAL